MFVGPILARVYQGNPGNVGITGQYREHRPLSLARRFDNADTEPATLMTFRRANIAKAGPMIGK